MARVNRPEHRVQQVLVPWAEPGGRFTTPPFEALVITWFEDQRETGNAASWSTAHARDIRDESPQTWF